MTQRGPNKLVTALAKAQKEYDPPLAARIEEAGDDEDKIAEAYAQYPADRLVTLEGYLGAIVEKNGVKWRVVYGDATCSTWVLMPDDAIVRHREGPEDKEPPFDPVDVLWLKADAPVLRGREALHPDEIEARSLRGEFIQAGELAASMGGGTFSGLFGPTPPGGTCGRKSYAQVGKGG
jgi:hypothetical protein